MTLEEWRQFVSDFVDVIVDHDTKSTSIEDVLTDEDRKRIDDAREPEPDEPDEDDASETNGAV